MGHVRSGLITEPSATGGGCETASRDSVAPIVPPEHVERLERILHELLGGHDQLLVLIQRIREAVRKADLQEIVSLCEQENTLAQRLAELEKERLVLVGTVTELLSPAAEVPLSLGRIAEAVGQPAGHALSELAGKLRSIVAEARQASSVLRAASESLGRHMGGLMQTVQGAISRANVYSHRGRITGGTRSQLGVDLTS